MTVDEQIALGIGVILFGIMLYVLLSWLFSSLIRYRVLKLFRPCSPAIGFVPFIGQYMVGKCCNGKDGQNTGIFNTRMSNFFWNWGWCSYFFCFIMFAALNYVTDGSPLLAKFFVTVAQVFNFMYWSSLYAFLYSRIEGKPESEVRVIAIVSTIIGIVGIVKVLTIGVTQVYSLPNDIYPLEDYSHPGGSYYAGDRSLTQDEMDYMK